MSKEESPQPPSNLFKPITNIALKVEELPKIVGNTLEALPNNTVLGIKYANEKVNEIVDVSADLANPIKFGKIAKNLGQISNNIDSEALKNVGVKFINGALNNATSTTTRVLMTNPLTGIPLATGISLVNAARTVSQALEKVSQIADDAIDKTSRKINLPSAPNVLAPPSPPPPPDKKRGGAKTRRQLKRVIRDRELIQTRTNKMIQEFMNPRHTITHNKKNISNKSKRRRRR